MVTIPDEAIEAARREAAEHFEMPFMARVRDFTDEQVAAGELQAADADAARKNREAVEAMIRAAAPLIVAANSATEVPDDVIHAAWHEYVYPLSAVERPMTPGFERAMAVINQWLAARASVLRGEGDRDG